jgi:hypothetical protein
MAYLLDRITESLAKEGLTPRTNKARAWLRSKANQIVGLIVILMMRDRNRLTDSLSHR